MSGSGSEHERQALRAVAAIREDVAKLKARGDRFQLHEHLVFVLELHRTSNLGTEFVVAISFLRCSYPLLPPKVRLLRPNGLGPHQYGDGTLCLNFPWNPASRDFLAFVAAIDAYLALYERFRLTGESWGGE